MDLPKHVSVRAKTGVAVILGVDTHLDEHVAVALDGLGRRLGTLRVSATTAGYLRLLKWATDFGTVEHAGVEGTGSFGAGLARFLRAEGIEVFEVLRPKRRDQYRSGKSDPIDAEAAARAVFSEGLLADNFKLEFWIIPHGNDGCFSHEFFVFRPQLIAFLLDFA